MEIIYQHNPLANKIILNEAEKKLLFWKYLISTRVSDELSWLSFRIDDYKKITDSETVKSISKEFLDDPINEIYKKIKEIEDTVDNAKYDEEKIKYFVEALQDIHFGDCISECNSCLKCFAESELDIESMPNFPWRENIGRSLYHAFSKKTNVDEAIEYLGSTEYPDSGFEQKYVDQWIERDRKAKEYLIYYKKEILESTIGLTKKIEYTEGNKIKIPPYPFDED